MCVHFSIKANKRRFGKEKKSQLNESEKSEKQTKSQTVFDEEKITKSHQKFVLERKKVEQLICLIFFSLIDFSFLGQFAFRSTKIISDRPAFIGIPIEKKTESVIIFGFPSDEIT